MFTKLLKDNNGGLFPLHFFFLAKHAKLGTSLGCV
jgi:hypothetical protein